MVKKTIALFAVLLLSFPFLVDAQYAGEPTDLAVWSAGLIDPANNQVQYSVLFTSGAEALTDVTVTAQLPETATFVSDFWKPEVAVFVGEQDGIVSWTLDSVEANTAVGPFTVNVSFEDSESDSFAPPAAVRTTLTSSAGTIEGEVDDSLTLVRLTSSGSLDITPEGFLSLTAVEDTGLWVFAPEGVVDAPLAVSFERLPLSDQAALPAVAEDTWWCGQISLSADRDVTLAQPIVLVIPLARASTPGTIMPVFAQIEDGEWQLLSADSSVTSTYTEGDLDAPAFARVTPFATSAYILLNDLPLTTGTLKLAVGISTTIRVPSTQSINLNVTLPSTQIIGGYQPWF
ncbi:MAG: hypothetical protein U0670_21000 [Anaerolineae bacterium]